MIAIRKAELSDAKRLVEIYDYSVKNTAITLYRQNAGAMRWDSVSTLIFSRRITSVKMDNHTAENERFPQYAE